MKFESVIIFESANYIGENKGSNFGSLSINFIA